MPRATAAARRQYPAWFDKAYTSVTSFLASKLFFRFVLVWFLIQAVYLALVTRVGLPPDEHYHLGFIRFFTDHGWSPILSDQSCYFWLGDAIKTPFFLYHYLLSIPYHLFDNTDTAVTVLRLINVGLGAGSLWLTKRIAEALKITDLVKNLSLFMLSSTLMFVLLSASVNYDNLYIFLALASVLLLIYNMQAPSRPRLLLLVACLLAGLLTKISFIPIAFIVVSILVVTLLRQKNLTRAWRKNGFSATWQAVALWLLFGILAALFVQRYVGNIAAYQTFSPDCTQVHAVEQCRENPVFARDERLDNSVRPSASKNIVKYIGGWILLMEDRIFGVFAHESFTPHRLVSAALTFLLLLGLIAIIRLIRWRDQPMLLLLLISGGYLLVLIAENFVRYQKYGSFSFAVQGRYAFAVLPLVYLIGNHYILQLLQKKILRLAYIGAVLVVLAVSSLPSYWLLSTPEWRKLPAISQR